MDAKVKLYTTNYCPYCVRAKRLLESKGISFEEINLEGQPEELSRLKERTGWRTVPQIFINDKLIGGYDELAALDRQGKL
jgi:glutaredoxin 3